MMAQGPSTQASEGVQQFTSCGSYLKSEEPFDDKLLGRTPKTISAWYKLKDCEGDGDGAIPLFGFGSTSSADDSLPSGKR